MPYSKNPDRVIQLLPWLSYLLEGKDCFWDLTGRAVNAQTFAYRVREALHISKTARLDNSDLQFPDLAAVADNVVIEVDEEKQKVYGRFGNVLNVSLPAPITALAERSPQLNMAPLAKAVVYSIETIKMLWAKRQGNKINLPMYTPDGEMLTRIYEWAQSLDPRVMLMPSDDALTLIVSDPELEGMDWTPADN